MGQGRYPHHPLASPAENSEGDGIPPSCDWVAVGGGGSGEMMTATSVASRAWYVGELACSGCVWPMLTASATNSLIM